MAAKPVSQSLVNEANIAKAQEQIAKACKSAVQTATDRAFGRIKGTKKKITSYRISGGKVYLTVEAGIPSASFNKDHWIEGINTVGVRGRIDNDFSFVSGSTTEVQYNTSAGDLSIQIPKNAYVYSVDPSKNNNRNQTLPGNWNLQLAAYATIFGTRKLSYSDLPQWESSLNPNSPNAPLDFTDPIERDDVVWYEIISSYNKFCSRVLTQKKKETISKQKEVKTAQGIIADSTKPKADGSGGKGKDTPPAKSNGSMSGVGDDTKPVVHNLPAVKEMYFTAHNLANFNVQKGNLPSVVDAAENLWKNSAPHKGMIQSYIVPARLDANGKWWNPNNAAGSGLGGVEDRKRINTRRYGFQFQYNPSTVQMAYAGAPQVDIGLQTSGTDKVPLIGSSVTSSTVTFSVIINRMHDFKYIDAIAPHQKFSGAGAKPVYGQLPVREIYSHVGNHGVNTANAGTAAEVTSIAQELRQIKELGTMYDIEYLLRTLLGYQLKSSLRNKFTSDIGYLGAYPVELHLGKNMRYLGVIDGFNVSHTIFNENMVPVFSNVTITFSRLPDFAQRFGTNLKNTKNVDTSDTGGV